jgi:FkbM family methyltransferase
MQAANFGEFLRRVGRKLFPKRLYTICAWTLNWTSCLLKVGYSSTGLLRKAELGSAGAQAIEVNLPQLQHPFYLRPGTSDAGCLIQNVVREEWGAFLPSGQIRFIVDGGANCGDTTAWYLSKFPEATVVALEPDAENYAMLRKNCEPYGARAVLLNAALWSDDTKLEVVHSGMRTDGFHVKVGESDADGMCEGISMPQLLRLINAEYIDILKLDIEGAELQLFSRRPEAWLPAVRCVAVELHGAAAAKAVYSAMSSDFVSRTYRNVHIFRRLN